MTESQIQGSGSQSNSRILSQASRIFLAGHRGMVGSAIYRRLQAENYHNIVTRTHEELDLIDQAAVRRFFENEKIDAVILAAAKVGGIHANNTYRAQFIFENIMIQANVIHEAFRSAVERLLFLGSSCIYPKYAKQPMTEEQLLTGALEPTNEPYAIAKIAGIKLCESFNQQYGTHYRCVMPTNIYGCNDNFDLENSHVLPAMIRKFHLAKLACQGDWQSIQKDENTFGPIAPKFLAELKALANTKERPRCQAPDGIKLWGSGRPRREFLHVDDLASACLFLLNLPDETYDSARNVAADQQDQSPATGSVVMPEADLVDQKRVPHINVGSGKDIRINELAELIQAIVGYQGAVIWDLSMPDGTPRKLLDISRLTQLGWKPEMRLSDGIQSTYQWYLTQTEKD
ncbi:MAG: GDP-L-fucose synthase [Desulfobacterales bacterium]|jgi:GDP-L-fucose synthase